MNKHELVISRFKAINLERLEMTLVASACSAAFLFGVSACGGGLADAAVASEVQTTAAAQVVSTPSDTASNPVIATGLAITTTALTTSLSPTVVSNQTTAEAPNSAILAAEARSLAGAKAAPLATSPTTGPMLEGCPLFPSDHILNQPIDTAPVHPNSAAFISSIGATKGAKADFGSGTYLGGPIGISYNVVTRAQAKVPVVFEIAGESDPGPYPIPPDALVEGGNASTGVIAR
jgi:hypothetical protein